MSSTSSTSTTYWRVGALYGAAAVVFGAFGAHGLKTRISDPAKIAAFSTGAHYQAGLSLVCSTPPLAAADTGHSSSTRSPS